ncbi:uncharacterized protein LOC108041559 [Drosophila rhopaloa]|uniref:Uncharacterized protein LOC108041559 n=1 Tax=Drosophila rhopaloa TaxID=1041015 RepID=A0A6P4EAC4_DRORH|nr:uncharacterized protein LOC108041559 [Drosophila rhopaloa]
MSETKVKSRKQKEKKQKSDLRRRQGEEEEKRHRQLILGQLSRAPGKCPLGDCEQIIFPSSLLVHLLHKHSCDPHTLVAIIFGKQALRLTFDPDNFQKGVPEAMAVLLYGGLENKARSLPVRRMLSFPNAGLLHDRRPYENHLTLVLMICKTTWYCLLPDKELATELAEISESDATIYVMWLVAPVTAKRIFYTLTIFDSSYLQSRSVIRKTRNYTHSQNPNDFLTCETDFMLIRKEEAMALLNDDDSSGIQLELIIQEDPVVYSLQIPSSRHLFETYNGPGSRMPRNKMDLNRDANGKLSLNRKPLSNPTIAVPLATHPELGNYKAKSGAYRIIERSRERSKSKYVPAVKAYQRGSSANRGESHKRGLRYTNEMGQENSFYTGQHDDQENRHKKEHGRRNHKTEEGSKCFKKDDKKVGKKRQSNFETSHISVKESFQENYENNLEKCDDAAIPERSFGGEDLTPNDNKLSKGKAETNFLHHCKATEYIPLEPEERPETSEGVTRESMKATKMRRIKELQQSILDLQVPITKEVLQSMKEAVLNLVKEAVRKVAQETVITKIDLPSELEFQVEPETKPENETMQETQSQTKIPGVSISIEAVYRSDCDLYSEPK